MGSQVIKSEMNLECVLTFLQSGKKRFRKVSISFAKLMKLVAKPNMTGLEISNSFYEYWTISGVKALINTALSSTKVTD